ncbi:galactolipase DONGLE, chloroplastic-like [Dendrobium catenatum]|uniref:Phospholipase A1 EG1, chloroplastic/mitochondrial n=1 Tax=Dendrobium catenatum TaxID=906689 RepID=A0A2I0WPT6_9ASPA|nr:galactolipase DONGLE, chloroplastic-like [Dendrobium catenatum]PKU77674.1 Galactolipase DONGLE, chloroplastic [Dendrobium catenatum]
MSAGIALPYPSFFSGRSRALRRTRPLIVTCAARSHEAIATDPNPSPSLPLEVATRWRDIQGRNNWEHLIQPLHPLLGREIVRYAELVNACYKAFDLDPTSKRYLNCKHGKSTMLCDVGMPSAGYKITKYIYATPDITIPSQFGTRGSRWIGYVAVSADDASSRLGRRDILVSFRGTVTNMEWITNLMSCLTPARLDPHNPRPDVKVESGFLSLYTSDDSTCRFNSGSCRQQLLSEISRIVSKYKDEKEVSITLAGHSMGSSLALLLGYDIAELGLNNTKSGREVPITVYSYGGPRVGNWGFRTRCEELGVKVLRVVNVNDPVTKMPGVFFNEKLELPWISSCSCYAHVGVELALDFFKMKNPACVHDLNAYIGWLKCANRKKAKKQSVDIFCK